MKNYEAIGILSELADELKDQRMDEKITLEEYQDRRSALRLAINILSEREAKGIDWRSIEDAHVLKARHSDYVIYQVDFLLNNLGKEIYILESGRRGTPCEIARSED